MRSAAVNKSQPRLTPEKELALLRQLVEEKDRALAEKDKELQHVKDTLAKQPGGEAYHILKPTLDGVRAAYDKTSGLPILRHVLRFSVSVADVGMSRMTPFGSCAGLNEQVGRLAPFLDEQVISPQIQAWRTAVVALCGPAVESASATADPYIAAVRPYVDWLVCAASPFTSRVVSIARPIALRAITGLQPQIETFEEAVEDVAEKVDHVVEHAVENLDAEKVFAEGQRDVALIAQFAKAHSADAAHAIEQATSAVHEIADAAAGLPK